MTKYPALIIILALRLIYQPSHAQPGISPFASPSPLPTVAASPAKVISVNGSVRNHKVLLQWVVGENETAEQFEVEKSTDGISFTMAALVFGTDKADTGTYEFYEKAGPQKVLYRIKLINKNKKTEYSPVIEINPDI